MAFVIRWAERLFLTALGLGIIVRVAPQIGQHPQLLLFLVSELIGVVLILSQRRGEATVAPIPVIAAFLCTGASLLVLPQGAQLVPDSVSTALVFGGAAIALAAKLSLRRSFGIVPANRGVMRGGVYRVVRHPMYSGYMIGQLGFLLVYFSLWNLALYAFVWLAFVFRAQEEEKFLSADPTYREYAAQVRSRLLPGVV
ncbi:MAG TPA: isoprenylcysteine carboxylmethyltransferase family protein [Novosphingobium sp.]